MSETGLEVKTVALIGQPNSGKTTLYNWLTGSNFKTVNYPGSTVEYSIGKLAARWGQNLRIVDTPGVYSLQAKSEDEHVTIRALFENPQAQVHAVIVVADGTQLARHLLLLKQAKSSGFPIILAVTMMDLLRKQKINLNLGLLSKKLGVPVFPIDGLLGGGIQEMVAALPTLPPAQQIQIPQEFDATTKSRHLRECEQIFQECIEDDPGFMQKNKNLQELSQKLDQVLLHPVLGVVAFIILLGAVFSSVFWFAQPFMDGISASFDCVVSKINDLLPSSLWRDFLTGGLIIPIASVLVFVPQIFILFFSLSILEASGYLARAASLIDKPLEKFGLGGRSFLPLLSGFACAVPAMMATRNIASKRERWIVNMIIPLMTCSARLPVYSLLLAFLFLPGSPVLAGLSLTAIYFLSAVIGLIAASILNQFLPQKDKSLFTMELPLYRRPRLKVLFQQAFTRTNRYIIKAGPTIFLVGVLIWFSTNFPRQENQTPLLEQSYLGEVGQKLEPIFHPMGADWRVGVGLISAFAAREVFVSSMAIIFHVQNDDESAQEQSLTEAMKTATNSEGQLIFTVSTVCGLIVFFMIALQCTSTFVISMKESGSALFAWGQLLSLNLIAYIICVGLVQGLRLLGIS